MNEVGVAKINPPPKPKAQYQHFRTEAFPRCARHELPFESHTQNAKNVCRYVIFKECPAISYRSSPTKKKYSNTICVPNRKKKSCRPNSAETACAERYWPPRICTARDMNIMVNGKCIVLKVKDCRCHSIAPMSTLLSPLWFLTLSKPAWSAGLAARSL
jgi:hypothetical protein